MPPTGAGQWLSSVGAGRDHLPGGAILLWSGAVSRMTPLHRFARACGIALLAEGAVILTGCKHAPAAGESTQSAFRFVTPPSPPAARGEGTVRAAEPREFSKPPEPLTPLASPTYPAIPRAGRPAFATVGLQLTIDREGRVATVRAGLHAFSTPGPWAEAFRAAAEAAVRQWRFRPAVFVQLEEVAAPDGGTFLRMKSSEAIESTTEVAFTFSATGDVRAGGATQER